MEDNSFGTGILTDLKSEFQECVSCFRVYTPFHEKTDDPVVKIGESIANALILLCIIICATLLLLFLYIYEFYKVCVFKFSGSCFFAKG